MTVEALREFGLREMTDGEIRNFLLNQGVGVLGLPAEVAPYLLPMAFGYDGESGLYFSYFLGERSRKAELSERAPAASFLVYSAASEFSWESVLCTGPLARLPEEEWDDHREALENAWHLDIFERGNTAGEIAVYEFDVREQRGIKHTGLPPGLAGEEPGRE